MTAAIERSNQRIRGSKQHSLVEKVKANSNAILNDFSQRNVVTVTFDFTIDTIISHINRKIINLNDIRKRPKYQRKHFWKEDKSSRLVESILLSVPIPNCYFAENDDFVYDVIDGQQRILSLYRFVNGEFGLTGLDAYKDLEGLKFSELPVKLQRKIRLCILRCIVIRAESDPQVKFAVFERLTSDVTPLRAQEIRNCIHRGKFNDMLGELANEELWLSIRNRKEPDSRMADEELILRFFSFVLLKRNDYKPPFNYWLNKAATKGARIKGKKLEELRTLWHETLEKSLVLFDPLECFRKPDNKYFNRILFDLVTYTARNADLTCLRKSRTRFRRIYAELLSTDEFTELMESNVVSCENTFKRIELWDKEFSKIGL